MVGWAFCYRSSMADPVYAVPVERAAETVAVPHYLERCVASRDTVESRAQKIEPIRATLKMDLVAMPSVMVAELIPKTIDSNVWPALTATIMNVNAAVGWRLTVDPMLYHKIACASITMLWY